MFEGRAPSELVLLTTFVGGRRSPALATANDSELRQSVHQSLAGLLGAGAPPLWSEVTRWARAIPQYTLGHLQRIAAVEAAEQATPGLFFCANYRGGVAIGDCVKSGHAIAERVIERLASSRGAQRPPTGVVAE
jgi:oxygen-dependent protoporphyrinogen oxidase